jgi:predicted dehydrogenase
MVMALKAGFIGYQFMGEAHANALARLKMFFPEAPEVEREVIVGRNESALETAADRFGFRRTETDWEAALDGIDVLYNLTPNHMHAEPSIAALERDIHVLCEKPLATNLETAQVMAEAAEASDGIAGCGFNYRFVPALRHAKNLIDDGEIGEITHFRARYLQDWLVDPDAPWTWHNSDELAGSGPLGDLGSHSIDLAHYLVGDIDAVSGQLKTFVDERTPVDSDEPRPVTVDDAFTAEVAFENGAIGTFEASRFATGHKNDQTIEIHGTKGSIRFELERLNELQVLREGNRGYETIMITDDEDPYIKHWFQLAGLVLGWEHSVVHENFEFLTTIEDGTDFHPDFQDGLAVQRVMNAVKRSDEDREWISL